MLGTEAIIIEAIFKKYGIIDYRYYKAGILYVLLTDLGIINMNRFNFSSDFINYNIKKGKLIMPPKEKSGRWKFRGSQMKEIIQAFLPGGTEFWDYRNSKIYEFPLEKVEESSVKPNDFGGMETLP